MATLTLDRTLDALANEHRREIVSRLSAGAAPTPELGAAFSMSKQALHRHLTVLEGAGLIERKLTGRVHEVRLVPDPLGEVQGWLEHLQQGWEANLDRLGAVLGVQSGD